MKPQMNETFRWMKNCADMSVFISVMVNGRFSHLYSQKSGLVGAKMTSSNRNPLKHNRTTPVHATASTERNKVPLSTSK